MIRQASMLVRAVATTSCLLKSSLHAKYSSPNGSSPKEEHGPPESARIIGFTAKMYAMVRKVATAPLNSVVKLVPRSVNKRIESILDDEC